MINETTSFNSAVMVKDANNVDVTVMYLSANLDGGTMNLSMNINIMNKELAIANAVIIKAQYAEFVAAVTERATELGYPIF